MSRIDTGLGWFCDSNYYVTEANSRVCVSAGTTFYKKNAGPAIGVKVLGPASSGSAYNTYLISTEQANVALIPDGSTQHYPLEPVIINGVTWYAETTYNGHTDDSNFPLINDSSHLLSGTEAIVNATLEAAKVYPRVDSGLGWSCDGIFYVDTANTFLGQEREGDLYKKNAGAAICGKLARSENVSCTTVLISTVLNNTEIDPGSLEYKCPAVIIDGTIWYMTLGKMGSTGDPNPSLPWFNQNDPIPYVSEWDEETCTSVVRLILTAVDVQPTAQQVITRTYLKSMLLALAPQTYNITIPASGWSDSVPYTQTITVNGLTSGLHPFMDLIVSDTVATGILETQNYNYITKVTTGTDSLTLKCYENKPTVDLTVFLKI